MGSRDLRDGRGEPLALAPTCLLDRERDRLRVRDVDHVTGCRQAIDRRYSTRTTSPLSTCRRLCTAGPATTVNIAPSGRLRMSCRVF